MAVARRARGLRLRRGCGLPAAEIEIAVELDAEHVTLRYPVSPARPNEPILCASSLIVPITARLRLGEAQAELSGLYVTYEKLLGLSAALDEIVLPATGLGSHDGFVGTA